MILEVKSNSFDAVPLRGFIFLFQWGFARPGVVLLLFDAQQDAVRNLLAKQLKGMTHVVRVIFIGYRQSDVEKCSERLKSNSVVNCLEQLQVVSATTLKLPTLNRKFFGTGSNKGNLLTDVPLVCLV